MKKRVQVFALLALCLGCWSVGWGQRAQIRRHLRGLESENLKVQERSVKALVEIGPPVIPGLLRLMKKKLEVRSLASMVLSQIGRPAVSPLAKALRSSDERVRSEAAWSLAQLGATARGAVSSLVWALRDSKASVRIAVIRALSSIGQGGASVRRGLTRVAQDRQWQVRVEAAKALGRLGDTSSLAVLRGMFADARRPVQAAARRAHRALSSQLHQRRALRGTRQTPASVAWSPKQRKGCRGYKPLRVAVQSALVTFDPHKAHQAPNRQLLALMYEPLVSLRGSQVVGRLAASWRVSTNGKRLRFKLRKGVVWHNGKPFDARDVVHSIRRFRAIKSRLAARVLASSIRRVKASGRYVIVDFRRSMRFALRWFDFAILPHPSKQPNKRAIVGTGPFRWRRQLSRKIELARFARHWSRLHTNKPGLRWRVLADSSVRLEVLRYGAMDLLPSLPLRHLKVVKASKSLRWIPLPTSNWWSLVVNFRKPGPLRELKVRQALAFALPRERISRLYGFRGQPLGSPLDGLGIHTFHRPRSWNNTKAEALLKQAGWRLSRGKKVRKKGQKRLVLRWIVPKELQQHHKRVFRLLVRSLRRVGVDAKLSWIRYRAWSSTVARRKFDLMTFIWDSQRRLSLRELFHSKGKANLGGYRSAALDRLLLRGERTTTLQSHRASQRRIHAHLHSHLPHLFLWSARNLAALSRCVSHPAIHPRDFFFLPSRWLR